MKTKASIFCCFFDNYKDICAGLKDEDVRMMLAVKQICSNFGFKMLVNAS
ncbi:hypothetical protein [Yersinia pekkanenii]|uniref:Uncharacterized protein n=1 Tax=Yersinia pekkanenii TaxID=1288385 RepID=A0A0T9REW1_9GAMM|nr:hypothetical protein [Yersinia pekkanenii]CNI57227.1 Uncharacterised protein [Yersinia pekkanenii]CRY66579.1 Uncharacterised protein [Yersinia pekkanenii]